VCVTCYFLFFFQKRAKFSSFVDLEKSGEKRKRKENVKLGLNPDFNNAECGFDGYDCLVLDCNIDTGSLCTKYKERFPDCLSIR
jgi:hypothetical protein